MDPVLNKFPASPERGNLPLWPVSPSRENRLPTLASAPSISSTRAAQDRFASAHARSNSDVQNKVAAFNHLTKEAAQRKKDNEAALKRAMLGREEAESETRRLKEENDTLRREIEEGRGRERKVVERLESMMEELQREKTSQAHAQTVYGKEVRRARKEAFKSSSALVNLQEELKNARNRYTLMRVEAEEQKQKSIAKEEELSTAQQQLMAVQEELNAVGHTMANAKEGDAFEVQQELEATREELNTLKDQRATTSNSHGESAAQNELREVSEELFILQQKLSKVERKVEKVELQKQVIEEERDALKQSMEEEQVARSAALGAIALPPSREEARAASGSTCESRSDDIETGTDIRDCSEAMPDEPEVAYELSQLRNELNMEKRMRLEAQGQLDLSQMECQFGCCSCRVAEKQGKAFVRDDSLATAMASLGTVGSLRAKRVPENTAIPERPRSQQAPSRSATPKLALPQRPRSQQALDRQAMPWLLERPRSQQAGNRHTTPRIPQNIRSVTETIFKTAKELDLQARKSISHARSPSATPAASRMRRQGSEKLIDPALKANRSAAEAEIDSEEIREINFSSPYPYPPATEDGTFSVLHKASIQHVQAPSPTTDFNFTEIIPNIPSIPLPLPVHSPLTMDHANPRFDCDQPRAASTTTRIPLKDNSQELFSPPPDTPGGISREEALEQIRARRGRARSFAASHGASTPKKGILGTPRREISAPAIKRV